ncbi:hypothetical protein GCM10022419_136050 [Nonomuraea rosea]|uniref:Uncharacterized protein n=1 Tax=Nonomuraea rosea TaxID=638574 RepID=A0ABP7A9C6_9ACTN
MAIRKPGFSLASIASELGAPPDRLDAGQRVTTPRRTLTNRSAESSGQVTGLPCRTRLPFILWRLRLMAGRGG